MHYLKNVTSLFCYRLPFLCAFQGLWVGGWMGGGESFKAYMT